jgi:glycerol uptake facilitator-like aquaporin
MTDAETWLEGDSALEERSLAQRLLAEGVGTAFLLVAVVGSGITASNLSPDDRGLQLLENAAATAAALIALIWMMGSISGAHFNPAVTLTARAEREMSTRDSAAYIGAQLFGACVGVVLANLMFELPAIEIASTERWGPALWLSEILATVGLLLVIYGCIRGGKPQYTAVAVGVWIGGAHFFMSSTSFANPAVSVARMLTDTFTGVEPASAAPIIVMQLVGAVIAVLLIRLLFPTQSKAS